MTFYTDRNLVFNTKRVVGKLKDLVIEIIQSEIYRRTKDQ